MCDYTISRAAARGRGRLAPRGRSSSSRPSYSPPPGGPPRSSAELGLAHALNGNRAEALRLVSDLITCSKQRYVSPFDVALIYAGLRDPRTRDWLQRAERDRSPSLNFLILSPAFAGMRTD